MATYRLSWFHTRTGRERRLPFYLPRLQAAGGRFEEAQDPKLEVPYRFFIFTTTEPSEGCRARCKWSKAQARLWCFASDKKVQATRAFFRPFRRGNGWCASVGSSQSEWNARYCYEWPAAFAAGASEDAFICWQYIACFRHNVLCKSSRLYQP